MNPDMLHIQLSLTRSNKTQCKFQLLMGAFNVVFIYDNCVSSHMCCARKPARINQVYNWNCVSRDSIVFDKVWLQDKIVLVEITRLWTGSTVTCGEV